MRGTAESIRWGWRLVLVGAVLMGACRDPAKASGTALYITAEFDPSLLITQVRVWGDVDGQPHFGPQVLPEKAQRVLNSGETLRVLLGDVPNGVRAEVNVEGLRDGSVVARGTGGADIRDGYEVEVSLRLEPTTPGNPDTFCLGCEGCCIQGQCTSPTFNTCGTGGIACVACDPNLASHCDGRGVCMCGASTSCSPRTADRCLLGMCRCGNSQECGPGQQCVSGQCICSPESCAGCCTGNVCDQGTSADRCGRGGVVCQKCDKKQSCTAEAVCG
ncbi:hypothetical protein BON30_39390 [Cystobacter ferrugineus]|uniref:Uncharacterized protein n=1 Tax=Cystobacter ferrugineus TaxID=83449 RepID=A0A1L9AZ62_9BACT|nr:hypothetical protein BON30_39390 [Cystobacter ferrugineus]